MLTAASARIAAGDYAFAHQDAHRDELEILSQGFDQMAGAVQDKVEALELSVQQRMILWVRLPMSSKTPMTGIIGYADLLRSMQPDPEEQREAAGAIFHEAQRLEALSEKPLQLMAWVSTPPNPRPCSWILFLPKRAAPLPPRSERLHSDHAPTGLTVQEMNLLCDLVIKPQNAASRWMLACAALVAGAGLPAVALVPRTGCPAVWHRQSKCSGLYESREVAG